MENEYYHLECPYPLLVTVTKDINTPRLPTFRDKLKSRQAKIETWCAEELSSIAKADRFGTPGSPTRVMKITVLTEEGRKGQIFRENDGNGISEIIRLFSDKVKA